jgi:hypothetical protein
MTYKIEDGEPVPPRHGNALDNLPYLIQAMTPGQWINISYRDRDRARAASNRVSGAKFTIRVHGEGYRIWRIE